MVPDPGSTLFASILNSSVMLGSYLQQTTSDDNIFRCIFFLALQGLNLIQVGHIFCFDEEHSETLSRLDIYSVLMKSIVS